MKCPEYIRVALEQRAKAAAVVMDKDYIVCDWLEKHNIEVEDYDIRTGCEMYVNPYDSMHRILEAIKEAE